MLMNRQFQKRNRKKGLGEILAKAAVARISQRVNQTGQRADGIADFAHIHVADMAITDRGDGFGTFLDGVDGGLIEALLPHKVAAKFLANEINDLVANRWIHGLKAKNEPFNRVWLSSGKNAVDLSWRHAQFLRESLGANAVHKG